MVDVVFHNLDVSINRIRSIGGGARRYMGKLVREAMEQDVWPIWIKHISLTDHTLEDLARNNPPYPYSTRYGKDSFVHPDEDVHIQSGDLVQQSVLNDASKGDEINIQIINLSREYIYLRYGTRIMRMRDPGGATMRDAFPAIKKRFADGVKNAVIDYLTT